MISTEEEYRQAFKRLDEIWDFADENKAEFLKLVDEIEAYEKIHYPVPKLSTIDWIWYKIVQRIGIILR